MVSKANDGEFESYEDQLSIELCTLVNMHRLDSNMSRGVTVRLTAVFGKTVNRTVFHGFWFLKTVTVTEP